TIVVLHPPVLVPLDPQRMRQVQPGAIALDHVRCPIPTERGFHRHIQIRAGPLELGHEVRRRVIDPRRRHLLAVRVQDHKHRPTAMQVDPYIRCHQSLLATGETETPSVTQPQGPPERGGSTTTNQPHIASGVQRNTITWIAHSGVATPRAADWHVGDGLTIELPAWSGRPRPPSVARPFRRSGACWRTVGYADSPDVSTC